MDTLDVEILRHSLYIATDPAHAARGSLGPWQIARRVGVHGTTVKARLAALRARGILRDVVLAPHLSLLGARVFNVRFAFGSPASKDAALRELSEMPEVYSTRDFVGNDGWVGVLAKDPASAHETTMALGRKVGAIATEPVYEAQHPPIHFAMRPVDRRILHAYAPNAHRDAESVAEDAGTSARTVRRRLARLSEAKAFSVFLNLDVGSMSGAVAIMLEVRLANESASALVLNAFPEWTFREAARGDLVLLYLSAPDLGRVQDLCRRASALPGVVGVTPRFLLAARVNPLAIQAALAT